MRNTLWLILDVVFQILFAQSSWNLKIVHRYMGCPKSIAYFDKGRSQLRTFNAKFQNSVNFGLQGSIRC